MFVENRWVGLGCVVALLVACGQADPASLPEVRGAARGFQVIEGAPVSPWISVAPMWEPRYWHSATLLESGKVLVAGGGVDEATAEIYDPEADSWTIAARLQHGRFAHTATRLLDGSVLVVGGALAPSTVERYYPETDTWVASAPLLHARRQHTATLLDNGGVLVACGENELGDVLDAELYDPEADAWSPAGALTHGRTEVSATALQDGRVLVVGGYSNQEREYWDTAELYDPRANSWGTTGRLGAARRAHAAIRLNDGQVLVAGGFNGLDMASSERYDPELGTWQAGAPLNAVRSDAKSSLLQNGTVLLTGGAENASSMLFSSRVEIYDPLTEAWSEQERMTSGRYLHATNVLHDGSVLMTGGFDQVMLTSVERYRPSPQALGAPCKSRSDCASDSCADGFCCDTRCSAGDCDVCAAILGASANGVCTLLSGSACDDGNACTVGEACSAGSCVGGVLDEACGGVSGAGGEGAAAAGAAGIGGETSTGHGGAAIGGDAVGGVAGAEEPTPGAEPTAGGSTDDPSSAPEKSAGCACGVGRRSSGHALALGACALLALSRRRRRSLDALKYDPDPEGLGMLAVLRCIRCKRDRYEECVGSNDADVVRGAGVCQIRGVPCACGATVVTIDWSMNGQICDEESVIE